MKNPNQPQTPVFVEGTKAQRWAATWTPARESACLGLLAQALCQPCWTQGGTRGGDSGGTGEGEGLKVDVQ